ncbi:hypothetical protein QF023_001175 [Chryseobacterium sp. SLBN-27]|uniref:hypothetical protein n=1 Tax=Chryseobacterium sp. SLBN-27 TaxID=3042287 RepID=UPI0028603BAD|nr:hypothetical protein [Chryseobacterium sp. SLBN-27]MDR6157659.1 hypothetical protein [Chryseobacterium sp. SLBN-27]
MKTLYIYAIFILFSCDKKQDGSKLSLTLKTYEYTLKPWDDDAFNNPIYSTINTDFSIYHNIEKLNYKFKVSNESNYKIDSLFLKKYNSEYLENPHCPSEFKYVLLIYQDKTLKYIAKFRETCEEGFLINVKTKKTSKLDFGYQSLKRCLKD